MRRMSAAVLAALMAVSMVGAAGCTERGSKSGRSTSGAAGNRADPTPTTGRPSPSPSAGDPAGAACDDVLAGVAAATTMAWRLDDGQGQPRDEDRRQAGHRRCRFEVSSTATLPAAAMVVTFYRIDRRVDSTADDVRRRAADDVMCTEPLAGPPPGAVLAVQCLQKHGGTLFNVNTTLSGPAGYVLVWVSMQPDRASTALHTRAREIGRQTAGVAFGLI